MPDIICSLLGYQPLRGPVDANCILLLGAVEHPRGGPGQPASVQHRPALAAATQEEVSLPLTTAGQVQAGQHHPAT